MISVFLADLRWLDNLLEIQGVVSGLNICTECQSFLQGNQYGVSHCRSPNKEEYNMCQGIKAVNNISIN